MKAIKMVDLQGQYRRIKSEIDDAIQHVIDDANFIQGPEVAEFSKNLSDYLGGIHVTTCGSGTDALQIAMMALNLKPGDEVILPVHTYVATAEVIALLGLTPVFVDVNEETFNLDARHLENKITPKTKAIVPVHLYGQCADMEMIMQIAQEHNLFVIEDVAQALGATYTFSDGHRKQAGTIGTIGTTSFFPSKNLGCFGDGGAVFTMDSVLSEKIKMIANHGQKIKYHHEVIGINSRLDTLQAAVLKVKLKCLDAYERKRNEVAKYYDHQLKSISQIKIPYRLPTSSHVFHQYTIQAVRRDELKTYLEDEGIPTMIYYPVPLHLQKAYRHTGLSEGSFPITEKLSKSVISLPIHTEMQLDEQKFICATIKKFYNG